MAYVEPEKHRSTLRQWGISLHQSYETLHGSNQFVFRLQSQNHIGATLLGPTGGLIASAYTHGPESYSDKQLLTIRPTISKDADSYRAKIIRHIDMWNQPHDTHFISATFNLAWVFWEAARRSQTVEEQSNFTLVVMRSALLRDAGAFLGNDVLFEEARTNKSLQRLQRLQRFTNSCQEILIPVIVTSNEIVTMVPLPVGSSIPSWIARTISPDETEYQPSEPVCSSIEEGSNSSEISSGLSPSETNEEQSKSSKDGSTSAYSSEELSGPSEDVRSESSSEDGQQIPDSNSSGGFPKFCDDCTSVYAEVSVQDQEAQARALARAILCDPDKIQHEGRIELPESELEDIAVLTIDIWRWPTRLKKYEERHKFREQQAAFDWPGRYARLLRSLKDHLDVDKLDEPTSVEQSASVPSPVNTSGKRKRRIIESEDSSSNHPEQRDEQHDSKRARSTLSEMEDEDEELL